MKVNRVKKLLISKCCHFVESNFLAIKYHHVSCICSMSLHCVCKVSDVSRKKLWYKLNYPCMHYQSYKT